MALWKQKKKASARGASRKTVKPSRKRVSFARLLPLVMVMVTASAVAGIYKGIDWVSDLEIERVVMAGDFRHANKNDLTQQVKPLLKEGFVAVDLDVVKDVLEQDPWVYHVQIERRWPGTLMITVDEQEAIARWGKNGLLNHRGQLFIPKTLGKHDDLPMLSGPEGFEETVIQQYSKLSELLRDQGFVLAGLHVNDRGSWKARLVSGVEIIFGRDNTLEKTQQFIRVYRQQLQKEFERVKRVDMRYSNGLAVDWKQPVVSPQADTKV